MGKGMAIHIIDHLGKKKKLFPAHDKEEFNTVRRNN
jgi:hypothetical protein